MLARCQRVLISIPLQLFLQIMRILVSAAVLLAVACHITGSDVIKIEGIAKYKMAALLRNIMLQNRRYFRFDNGVAHPRRVFERYTSKSAHNIYVPWLVSSGTTLSKKNVGDNQVCRMVCTFCRKVASLRVSALCEKQCTTGRGTGFIACFTYWSNREQMMATRI